MPKLPNKLIENRWVSFSSEVLSSSIQNTALAGPSRGFPGGSVVKNPPVMQETRVWSLGQEDSLEKEMATHSSVLAERIPWTQEPGGWTSMGLQSWTQLSDCHFQSCIVVFHCSNLYFPHSIGCEVSFHMLAWRLYVIFDVAPCKVFVPFLIRLVFLFLAFRGLCTFWMTVNYQMCLFVNIFSQSVACLLILFTFSHWSGVLNFNEDEIIH